MLCYSKLLSLLFIFCALSILVPALCAFSFNVTDSDQTLSSFEAEADENGVMDCFSIFITKRLLSLET